jgi:hypothetical protein
VKPRSKRSARLPDENEVPGILRPLAGTRAFRRRCRLMAEGGAVAVTNCQGKTTRFPLDGTDQAPAQMIDCMFHDTFEVVDQKGRGLVSGESARWDEDEMAGFCQVAGIEFVVGTGEPAGLRQDGVLLDEPAWLRFFAASLRYQVAGGLILAPIGRFYDLSLWLMVPFLLWIPMYPVYWALGGFAPRRVGPAEVRLQREAAERGEKTARRPRKRKTPTR